MDWHKLAIEIGYLGDAFALLFEAFFFLLMSIVFAWVIGQGGIHSTSTELTQNTLVLYGLLIFFYKLKEIYKKIEG